MREGRKKGNVAESPSGIQEQMRKMVLTAGDTSSLAGVSRNIEGWKYGLLTRPC